MRYPKTWTAKQIQHAQQVAAAGLPLDVRIEQAQIKRDGARMRAALGLPLSD